MSDGEGRGCCCAQEWGAPWGADGWVAGGTWTPGGKPFTLAAGRVSPLEGAAARSPGGVGAGFFGAHLGVPHGQRTSQRGDAVKIEVLRATFERSEPVLCHSLQAQCPGGRWGASPGARGPPRARRKFFMRLAGWVPPAWGVP